MLGTIQDYLSKVMTGCMFILLVLILLLMWKVSGGNLWR